MATNHARLPQRRLASQRNKVDENAVVSRHVRQSSAAGTGPVRFTAKEHGLTKPSITNTTTRQALSEVTMAAVNRRQEPSFKPGMGKEKEEGSSKRARSDSTTLAQRLPVGPGRVPVPSNGSKVVNPRPVATRFREALSGTQKRGPIRVLVDNNQQDLEVRERDHRASMEIEEEEEEDAARAYEEELSINEQEVEAMIGIESSDEEAVDEDVAVLQPPETKRPRIWPEVSTDRAMRQEKELQVIRQAFREEIDIYDTTMVSEYAEEIFDYMCELEEEVMPNPDYMDGQNEITWPMRQTLVDWLLQVHLRYHMLPETLWIAVNIVDRFLTKRVVSLLKLQLVGVTAMFIAAKYEEILAPSVEEFVFMTENGYTKEEILKGERIMLQSLEFRISQYCSPYSWMRKISKADDYDIQTRTLSKFLTEVTLLDHRFLRVKPSLIAAVGMYSARTMLGGDWNEAFIFHSGYTEDQLIPGHELLVDKLLEDNFQRQYVCKKYANKKFLKASVFAIKWAKNISGADFNPEGMVFAE